MSTKELTSLYKHFLAADAVKVLLFVKVPEEGVKGTYPEELIAQGQTFSQMLRLQVFYSLLYVVVEGYREIGCQNASVDAILSEGDYLDWLRRFRNANFHYQGDPFSPKLLEFLESEGSEDWAKRLYRSLEEFFIETLRIRQILEEIGTQIG